MCEMLVHPWARCHGLVMMQAAGMLVLRQRQYKATSALNFHCHARWALGVVLRQMEWEVWQAIRAVQPQHCSDATFLPGGDPD